jgi:hypothetical protein
MAGMKIPATIVCTHCAIQDPIFRAGRHIRYRSFSVLTQDTVLSRIVDKTQRNVPTGHERNIERATAATRRPPGRNTVRRRRWMSLAGYTRAWWMGSYLSLESAEFERDTTENHRCSRMMMSIYVRPIRTTWTGCGAAAASDLPPVVVVITRHIFDNVIGLQDLFLFLP